MKNGEQNKVVLDNITQFGNEKQRKQIKKIKKEGKVQDVNDRDNEHSKKSVEKDTGSLLERLKEKSKGLKLGAKKSKR